MELILTMIILGLLKVKVHLLVHLLQHQLFHEVLVILQLETYCRCSFKSLTGSGTGAVASVTVATIIGVAGAINAVTLSTLGTGYQVGDVLTSDNANDSDIAAGFNLRYQPSTLNLIHFLTNVQGSQFTTNRKLENIQMVIQHRRV